MGIAGSGPQIVVHKRCPHQKIFKSRLLTRGDLGQLSLSDTVEYRYPQQHFLLHAG